MNAVHIQTDGMYCPNCPPRIERAVERLPGVKAARASRAMALTSVLYDPDIVDAKSIEAAIKRAGFPAHLLVGGTIH